MDDRYLSHLRHAAELELAAPVLVEVSSGTAPQHLHGHRTHVEEGNLFIFLGMGASDQHSPASSGGDCALRLCGEKSGRASARNSVGGGSKYTATIELQAATHRMPRENHRARGGSGSQPPRGHCKREEECQKRVLQRSEQTQGRVPEVGTPFPHSWARTLSRLTPSLLVDQKISSLRRPHCAPYASGMGWFPRPEDT